MLARGRNLQGGFLRVDVEPGRGAWTGRREFAEYGEASWKCPELSERCNCNAWRPEWCAAGRGTTVLSAEHRAAPALGPVDVRLVATKDASAPPHLEIVGRHTAVARPTPVAAATPGLPERLWSLLQSTPRPLTRVEMRARLRVNNQRLGQVLEDLHSRGVLTHSTRGWQIDKSVLPGETESDSAGTQPGEG